VRLVNATPHTVDIYLEDRLVLSVPASGTLIRLAETRELLGELLVDGVAVPVYRQHYGAAQLPPERPGVFYIVSVPVAQAYPRRDLLVPGRLLRDGSGRVLGCEGLSWLHSGEWG